MVSKTFHFLSCWGIIAAVDTLLSVSVICWQRSEKQKENFIDMYWTECSLLRMQEKDQRDKTTRESDCCSGSDLCFLGRRCYRIIYLTYVPWNYSYNLDTLSTVSWCDATAASCQTPEHWRTGWFRRWECAISSVLLGSCPLKAKTWSSSYVIISVVTNRTF